MLRFKSSAFNLHRDLFPLVYLYNINIIYFVLFWLYVTTHELLFCLWIINIRFCRLWKWKHLIISIFVSGNSNDLWRSAEKNNDRGDKLSESGQLPERIANCLLEGCSFSAISDLLSFAVGRSFRDVYMTNSILRGRLNVWKNILENIIFA